MVTNCVFAQKDFTNSGVCDIIWDTKEGRKVYKAKRLQRSLLQFIDEERWLKMCNSGVRDFVREMVRVGEMVKVRVRLPLALVVLIHKYNYSNEMKEAVEQGLRKVLGEWEGWDKDLADFDPPFKWTLGGFVRTSLERALHYYYLNTPYVMSKLSAEGRRAVREYYDYEWVEFPPPPSGGDKYTIQFDPLLWVKTTIKRKWKHLKTILVELQRWLIINDPRTLEWLHTRKPLRRLTEDELRRKLLQLNEIIWVNTTIYFPQPVLRLIKKAHEEGKISTTKYITFMLTSPISLLLVHNLYNIYVQPNPYWDSEGERELIREGKQLPTLTPQNVRNILRKATRKYIRVNWKFKHFPHLQDKYLKAFKRLQGMSDEMRDYDKAMWVIYYALYLLQLAAQDLDDKNLDLAGWVVGNLPPRSPFIIQKIHYETQKERYKIDVKFGVKDAPPPTPIPLHVIKQKFPKEMMELQELIMQTSPSSVLEVYNLPRSWLNKVKCDLLKVAKYIVDTYANTDGWDDFKKGWKPNPDPFGQPYIPTMYLKYGRRWLECGKLATALTNLYALLGWEKFKRTPPTKEQLEITAKLLEKKLQSFPNPKHPTAKALTEKLKFVNYALKNYTTFVQKTMKLPYLYDHPLSPKHKPPPFAPPPN